MKKIEFKKATQYCTRGGKIVTYETKSPFLNWPHQMSNRQCVNDYGFARISVLNNEPTTNESLFHDEDIVGYFKTWDEVYGTSPGIECLKSINKPVEELDDKGYLKGNAQILETFTVQEIQTILKWESLR